MGTDSDTDIRTVGQVNEHGRHDRVYNTNIYVYTNMDATTYTVMDMAVDTDTKLRTRKQTMTTETTMNTDTVTTKV